MTSWYRRVANDLTEIPDCIDYFEKEAVDARADFDMYDGKTIEHHVGTLPGHTEFRFAQLQEINAILECLNIQLSALRSERFTHYTEHYNRTLSSRDAEKYIDGDQKVVNMLQLINEFALIRNIFTGIIKGIDSKNFMLTNIVKLRVAGLDDATL